MGENKEYITQIQGQSNVHISEDAICTVAAMAAIEVEGVAGLSSIGSDLAAIVGKKNLSKGVRVRMEEEELFVDLSLMVNFGCNIQTVAAAVQEAVLSSVESVVGLKVQSVNVHVFGISFES